MSLIIQGFIDYIFESLNKKYKCFYFSSCRFNRHKHFIMSKKTKKIDILYLSVDSIDISFNNYFDNTSINLLLTK